MRVLIDEDTAVQLLEPLRHLLRKHTVEHIATINWKGKKDRNVLPDARQAGYEVIITRDRNQFSDPAECAAKPHPIATKPHPITTEQFPPDRQRSPAGAREPQWSIRAPDPH